MECLYIHGFHRRAAPDQAADACMGGCLPARRYIRSCTSGMSIGWQISHSVVDNVGWKIRESLVDSTCCRPRSWSWQWWLWWWWGVPVRPRNWPAVPDDPAHSSTGHYKSLDRQSTLRSRMRARFRGSVRQESLRTKSRKKTKIRERLAVLWRRLVQLVTTVDSLLTVAKTSRREKFFPVELRGRTSVSPAYQTTNASYLLNDRRCHRPDPLEAAATAAAATL